jgi:hypothetical protein
MDRPFAFIRLSMVVIEYHVTLGGKQAPESADRADLFLPPYTNCSVRHDRESANEVCCAIGEHLGSNRDPPLARQTGQAQEYDPLVRLPTAEHQFAKVFVLSDQNHGLTVSSCKNVKIGYAGGQFGNVVNFISRAAESVHDLSLDALVREVSYSSAYRIDHIKAEDISGVLDRR